MPFIFHALYLLRSAAVAYCDGAMHAAMAWAAVRGDLDGKNNSVEGVRWCGSCVEGGESSTNRFILQVVGSASQAVSVMNAASYALMEAEAAMRLADEVNDAPQVLPHLECPM